MPPLAPPGSVALYPSGSTGGEGQKESFKLFFFFHPKHVYELVPQMHM